MLVLDEADRCLDMGFESDMNAIIAALPPPPARQTLLFSATQTKSVRAHSCSVCSPSHVFRLSGSGEGLGALEPEGPRVLVSARNRQARHAETPRTYDCHTHSLIHAHTLDLASVSFSPVPAQVQHYVVCPLENKLNLLYSFVKTHLKSKARPSTHVTVLTGCNPAVLLLSGHRVRVNVQGGQVLARAVP